MKVRGRRECTDCGTRWAYYETGSVACPDCGSMESVGLGDRELHTASPADLDLTAVREAVDEDPLDRVADAAKDACRAYLRKQGFLDGGDLLALDDTYLAARELVEAGDLVARAGTVDDDERIYLLDLLAGADAGERPASVPETMRVARGLAAARGVDEYLGEVRDWLAENPHGEVRPLLERVDDHCRRVDALQGDVPPSAADRLVAAARGVSEYLREGDESSLDAAVAALDRLDE